MRKAWLWMLTLVVLLAAAPASHARRLALVVGNNDYRHTAPLRNARNDADAVGKALEAAGFVVARHHDLDRDALFKAIDTLVLQAGKDDEVVFYFAGHGVQVEASPYLLPVDIRPDSARQLARDAVPLESVLADLGKVRYALVLVDACRNNPFAGEGRRAVGGERGLQPVEPPEGLAVMLSAGRGQAALDSLGPGDPHPNGVFTRELVRQMAVPGVAIRDLLLRVRDAVEQQAATVNHKQRPALIDESRGQFYFHAPATAVPAARPPAADASVEIAYWNSVQERGSPEELQLYLKRYPQGQFADLAQARIARQQAMAAAGPASAPGTGTGDAEARRQRALAEKGNPAAMASIGTYYAYGRHGLRRDPVEAVRWFRRGVEHGSTGAMAGLGAMYERGVGGLARDGARAMALYRESAARGDARGMSNLGWALASGLGGQARDDGAAVDWLRRAAAAGHPRAFAHLGVLHEFGRAGGPPDPAEALRWYQRGADVDEPLALAALGRMLENGRGGLARDEAGALALYRRAAAMGEALALLQIGYLHLHGRAGLPRDDAQAVQWYRQAIEAGSTRALAELGWMHAQGRGVPRDPAQALELYRRGAEAGDALALNNLGALHESGQGGVEHDEARAAALYRRAAELGHSQAMNNLALMYRDGRGGLPRDPAQARAWFGRAAVLGHAAARRNLDALR